MVEVRSRFETVAEAEMSAPRIIRGFPRKTKATPDDALAYFGPPDLRAEADEVHVSVTFTYSNKDSIDNFREWAGRALGFITASSGACVDCDFDTFNGEDYFVQDAIWKAASEASPRLPGGRGVLCIGCLERRLGRELTRADFVIDNPLNQDGLSDRMRDRLARG
jgi:hypothetical protein